MDYLINRPVACVYSFASMSLCFVYIQVDRRTREHVPAPGLGEDDVEVVARDKVGVASSRGSLLLRRRGDGCRAGAGVGYRVLSLHAVDVDDDALANGASSCRR